MFQRFKRWYYNLPVKKQLLFTFSMLFVYWFLAWLFFDRVIWKDFHSLWRGVLYASSMSLGLTILFEWRKVKSLFKKEEDSEDNSNV